MEKGDRTRSLIYNKAKELFAKYGYKATTMKQVTDELQLQPSWISYYFKQKTKVANAIIEELAEKISCRLNDTLGHIENPLLLRFIHMRLHYKVIISCPENVRFIYEVAELPEVEAAMRARLRDLVDGISRYYGTDYREEDIKFFSDISLSAFNLTWKRYYEGEYRSLSDDRLSLDATKVFALLLGIDSEALTRVAERSRVLADQVRVDDIYLLK